MLKDLVALYPDIKFLPSSHYMWSPRAGTVYYEPATIATAKGRMTLLHELGHAILTHHNYIYDIELLNMEVEAWSQARSLAKQLELAINEDHVEDCLDTYRLWIFKRSQCPTCANTSLQTSRTTYECFICHAQWKVAQNHSSLSPRRMQCLSPV